MGRISFIKASTKLVLRCFGASRALRIYTCLMTLMIMPLLAISAETEAEFRLESIKQALVDLAMQKDIKLGSSAYLDSQGILHESTVISGITIDTIEINVNLKMIIQPIIGHQIK